MFDWFISLLRQPKSVPAIIPEHRFRNNTLGSEKREAREWLAL